MSLHEDLCANLRRAIVTGEYRGGQQLPTSRELAEREGVSPNTMLRALRELRSEGLLEFRRGRGITVARNAERRGAVSQRIVDLVGDARKYGFRCDEVLRLVKAEWSRTRPVAGMALSGAGPFSLSGAQSNDGTNDTSGFRGAPTT